MIPGHKRGRHLNPKVTPEMVERMRALREQGLNWSAIAREIGVSVSAVMYHIRPGYRERVVQRVLRWQREHPERAREIKRAFRRRHQARYSSRMLKQKRLRQSGVVRVPDVQDGSG